MREVMSNRMSFKIIKEYHYVESGGNMMKKIVK